MQVFVTLTKTLLFGILPVIICSLLKKRSPKDAAWFFLENEEQPNEKKKNF